MMNIYITCSKRVKIELRKFNSWAEKFPEKLESVILLTWYSKFNNIISSHIKCGAICFCVVSEAASACNFVRQFSPRLFHGFHSNFAWLLVWTIRSAVRKMVDLDLFFKVTEVKLWPFLGFLPILTWNIAWIPFKFYMIVPLDHTQ